MFSSESLASILIDSENFTGLVQKLKVKPSNEFSSSIMNLYNRVLDSNEEDYTMLKPSVDDLLICSQHLTRYFFELCNSIDGNF